MGWREVIHHYLMACIEDSRQVPQPSSRAQFIDEHGTPALKYREYENRTRLDKRIASQQVPLPETYKVIEESPTRVMAEVEDANSLELFAATRFLVVKTDNQWHLDDTFSNCLCKNGSCFFCRGTGYCTLCYEQRFTRFFFRFTRWFLGIVKERCVLCQGKPRCKYCNATGRCEHCSQSPIPGWRSRSSFLPENEMGG